MLTWGMRATNKTQHPHNKTRRATKVEPEREAWVLRHERDDVTARVLTLVDR